MGQIVVTGLTAARMMEIEAASVTTGRVEGDILILTRKDGTPITAGNVRGPKGTKGDQGDQGTPGGAQLGGNLGGTLAAPKVTGALDGTVDTSKSKVTGTRSASGGGTEEITITMEEFLEALFFLNTTIEGLSISTMGGILKGGKAVTLWSGTQTEYNALPSATKTALGFVAVITK